LTNVTVVCAGGYHTVALGEDGKARAWGYNASGQLGDGTDINKNTPVVVKAPEGEGALAGMETIFGGGHHSIALGQDGSVWTWGNNNSGQLGDGTSVRKTRPVQVKGLGGDEFLEGIIAVAGGAQHTIALDLYGAIWTWGSNECGQLGDGTDIYRNTPVQVEMP
jgi:alpha-tubulin suppressor-like RCC1 family protein